MSIRLKDSRELEGKLQRVVGDSVEIRIDKQKKQVQMICLNDIETIRRLLTTDPVVYVGMLFVGGLAFMLFFGMYAGGT